MSAKPIGINQEKRFSPKFKQTQNPRIDFCEFFYNNNTIIMANNYFTAFELLNNQNETPRQQLLEGVFESTGLACIAGSTDTGKSMLLRDLCIAITQEEESFLGFKLNTKSHTAIFVSTEDSKAMTTELLGIQYEGLLHESQNRLKFIFNPDSVLDSLTKVLDEGPADIIVLDCFGDVFEGDPIKSNEIRSFLKKYLRLSEIYNCLIVFLHHTNKRTENLPPSKHNLHGGQAFQAKMRTAVELRRDLNIKDKRHFCIVKGNYQPDEQKEKSFVLYFDKDNLRFNSKGERAEYSTLYENTIENQKVDMFSKAWPLRESGLKHKEIAMKLGVSESTISRLFKEATLKKWDNDKPVDEDESGELQVA
jgi:RecA-family ATPase